jgi:hypothetical protein
MELLFERLLDLTARTLALQKIRFSSSPADTAEAVRRWL